MAYTMFLHTVINPFDGKPAKLCCSFSGRVVKETDPSDSEVRHLARGEDRYSVEDLKFDEADAEWGGIDTGIIVRLDEYPAIEEKAINQLVNGV